MKMAAHKTKLFLVAVVVLCSHVSVALAQTCKGDAGVAIARAYAIAITYPDSVPEFVKKNGPFFQPNGGAIKCGRVLASQLLSAALSGPSPNSIREQAADVADRAGRPELGSSLGDDMLENRSDMYQLAAYLQNLVETLPSIMAGNMAPYKNTAVYQNSKLAWGMMESLGVLPPGDIIAFRDMILEMSEWYVGNFASLVP
jgi:hypothetical protein